jgi:hypothetical protein
MRPDVPYFIILLCLMPDDFTCQGESAATQWVIKTKFSSTNGPTMSLLHIFPKALVLRHTIACS